MSATQGGKLIWGGKMHPLLPLEKYLHRNWWYNMYNQLADDFVSGFYEILECKNVMWHRIEQIAL